MQQIVSGSPRLCEAYRQQCSRTCSHESKRLRKLADEGRNQAPSLYWLLGTSVQEIGLLCTVEHAFLPHYLR
jgi:hypothetical protein